MSLNELNMVQMVQQVPFLCSKHAVSTVKRVKKRGGASQNEAGWGLDGDVQFAQFVPSYIDFTTTSPRNPVCD
jgi:hypothetical protein